MDKVYKEILDRLMTARYNVSDCEQMVRGRLQDRDLIEDYPVQVLEALDESIDLLDYALSVHKRLRSE